MNWKLFIPIILLSLAYGLHAEEVELTDVAAAENQVFVSEISEELEEVAREAKERIEEIKSREIEALEDERTTIEIDQSEENITYYDNKEETYDPEKRAEYLAEVKADYSRYLSLIKAGKALTFTGVASFITGTLFTGLGFVTFARAVYHADLDGDLFSWSKWARAFGKIHVANYGGATMFLWATGALFLLASWLIIPGIVIWSTGAYKAGKLRKKYSRNVSVHPSGTGFHFSVQL